MKIVVHKDASIQIKNAEDGSYSSQIFVPGDVIPVEDVTDGVLDEIKAGRSPHLALVDDDEVKRESAAAAASDLRNGDVVVTEGMLSSEEQEAAEEAFTKSRNEVFDLGGADVVVSAK